MRLTDKPLIIDEYIAPDRWGKDHWSTLAYIETRIVDYGSYTIGIDTRMRATRRTFRLMYEARAFMNSAAERVAESGTGRTVSGINGSVLNDGAVVAHHDDYSCLEDFAAAGLLSVTSEQFAFGANFTLSELGWAVSHQLRRWKARGGNFASFRWSPT